MRCRHPSWCSRCSAARQLAIYLNGSQLFKYWHTFRTGCSMKWTGSRRDAQVTRHRWGWFSIMVLTVFHLEFRQSLTCAFCSKDTIQAAIYYWLAYILHFTLRRWVSTIAALCTCRPLMGLRMEVSLLFQSRCWHWYSAITLWRHQSCRLINLWLCLAFHLNWRLGWFWRWLLGSRTTLSVLRSKFLLFSENSCGDCRFVQISWQHWHPYES